MTNIEHFFYTANTLAFFFGKYSRVTFAYIGQGKLIQGKEKPESHSGKSVDFINEHDIKGCLRVILRMTGDSR